MRTPIARGTRGRRRFRSDAKSPSAASSRFRRSSATRCPPTPIRSSVLARRPSSPFSSYSSARPDDVNGLALDEPELEPVVRVRAIVTFRLAPVSGSFSVRKTVAQAAFGGAP